MIQKIRNILGLEHKPMNLEKVEMPTQVVTKTFNIITDNGEVVRVGGNNENLFNESIEPKVVLRKLIEFAKAGKLVIKDKKGNLVTDTNIESFFKSPSPTQSIESLLDSWLYNYHVKGYSVIKKNGTTLKGLPISIFVLESDKVTFDFDTNYSEALDSSEQIKSIRYNTKSLNLSDTVLSYKPNPNDFTKPYSTFKEIEGAIDLLVQQARLRKTVLARKGAIGILSSNIKDGDGGIPLSEKAREKVQSEYRNTYGTSNSKDSLIITDSALTWQAMTFPLRDFQTSEIRQEYFNLCIDTFGLDRNVFSHTQGSTFANLKDGMKASYNNVVIPQANLFAKELTKLLALDKRGLVLEYDFSHLDVLKSDEKTETETKQMQINNVILLLQNQLITDIEAKKILKDLDIIK